MPRRGRSYLTDQRVFFVTTTVLDKEHLFKSVEKKLELRDILYTAVHHFKVELYGYVLMSNHFHLLIGIEGGGPQLSKFMQNIKSLSSRKLYPDRKGIWVRRFDDLAIYTDEQFRIKLRYIHENPVRAGMVDHPEDYEFSSAREWLIGGDL